MTVLSETELRAFGFLEVGCDVRIDRRAALFGVDHMRIGSHVRIDAYAVLTAGPGVLDIGSYCHVAPHVYVSAAQGGVTMGYGSGLAPAAAIYSAVEDYTGGFLTNPCVPEDLRLTDVRPVVLAPHVAIGSGSVVLAGITLATGASVGALSLVNRPVECCEVVHGNPIRPVARRNEERLRELDLQLRDRAAAEGLELPPCP
jgi:acetyltransferase-like isoleucine patch superfamily enzyme